MKNILHIATQAPGHTSGGELGTLQFSYALTHLGGETDYVGPPIADAQVAGWYRNVTYLDKKLTLLEKAWTIAHLQFDKKYLSWKDLRIDFSQYQVIFLEFTKLDYMVQTILKSDYKGKLIVRAHNVEQDFLRIQYESSKQIMDFLQYAVSAGRERYMVQNADLVLAITEADKKRLCQLYGLQEEKVAVCPVGVNLPMADRRIKSKLQGKLKCLITGSLWFGPNSEGTLWFIKEVYPFVEDICDLTIAGHKPNEEIRDRCKAHGIRLAESPESMKPYFEEAEMMIAPIFDGGGMKVKIAEAMSYGLPVVTTPHGATGYGITSGHECYLSKDAKGFAEAIRTYYQLDENQRHAFLEREWKLYAENYSLTAIRDYCAAMLENESDTNYEDEK